MDGSVEGRIGAIALRRRGQALPERRHRRSRAGRDGAASVMMKARASVKVCDQRTVGGRRRRPASQGRAVVCTPSDWAETAAHMVGAYTTKFVAYREEG